MNDPEHAIRSPNHVAPERGRKSDESNPFLLRRDAHRSRLGELLRNFALGIGVFMFSIAVLILILATALLMGLLTLGR